MREPLVEKIRGELERDGKRGREPRNRYFSLSVVTCAKQTNPTTTTTLCAPDEHRIQPRQYTLFVSILLFLSVHRGQTFKKDPIDPRETGLWPPHNARHRGHRRIFRRIATEMMNSSSRRLEIVRGQPLHSSERISYSNLANSSFSFHNLLIIVTKRVHFVRV